MKKSIVTVALVFLLSASIPALAQSAEGKHHAVFQLTAPEGGDWGALVAHVRNLKAAFKDDGGAEVEVVFYGAGLRMLLKSNEMYARQLEALAKDGVKLAACQNAMQLMQVTSDDLFPFAIEVDSGVAELVRKQEAGWAFIP